jgi:mRNA interferase RelE/StbE
MFKVILEDKAKKDIRSLPSKDITTIISGISELAENPRTRQSKKLLGSDEDYRLRIGNYRVLYTINDKKR